MEDLIEQILADSEERAWPQGTEREAKLPWLPRKVDAVIGMRRAGKTWFLQQTLAHLVSAGAPRASTVYLNFEDERLWQLDATRLTLFTEIFYRRHPELRNTQCVFVLDEIQAVPGWERFVRRLIDSENVHVCISGSSAKLLSKEIATSMRGRSLATEIFPFSFREFLAHHGIIPPSGRRPGSRQRSLIEQQFLRYLRTGGFPEVQSLDESIRRRILQEYLDVAMLRDVIERHGVTNVVALRQLVRQLLASPAGLFSVHRLYNDLRSQGVQVGKDSLHSFFDYLHDAFVFFPVPIHTQSERVRQSNPRKIYPVDPGLVTAASPQSGWGTGQLLETAAFLHLRRRGYPLSYFRHDDGTEVDFVVETPEGLEAIQVSADVTSADTRKRELRALEAAMGQLGVSQATLLTLTAEERISLSAGTVHIRPWWMWALDID